MNTNLLKGIMTAKGWNVETLAKVIGIDSATFYRKMAGKSEFTRDEIVAICKTLDTNPMPIFFADELTETQEN